MLIFMSCDFAATTLVFPFIYSLNVLAVCCRNATSLELIQFLFDSNYNYCFTTEFYQNIVFKSELKLLLNYIDNL